MDLRTIRWDDGLCQLFGVPTAILPEICASSGELGWTHGLDFLPDGLPITGVAGDQQASLIGQGCVAQGQAKCTFGTGAFLLAHTGERIVSSRSGLITTLAASAGSGPHQYAIEGSVFVAGAAVQWFRDGLRAIGSSPDINPLALGSDPDMDVIFVPALTGMGAPHWQPAARGTIFGLTRATSVADLARATLEGVAFQVADLIDAMNRDLGARSRISGSTAGWPVPILFFNSRSTSWACRSGESPQTESTAVGAGLLAGLGAAIWPDADSVIESLQSGGQEFLPERDSSWREQAQARWQRAVNSVLRHYS